MKKRYIICVNNSTEAQERRFLDYITKNNFGWWHRLNNTWLIIDFIGKSSAKEIRSEVNKAFDYEHNMVFDISKNTWAGYGPASGRKDMFTWIKENWKDT